MLKVSNSEALSVGSCETKWMFAFHPGFNLEPKAQSDALRRGNIGHAVLEVFFNAIKEGQKHEKASEIAIAYLVAQLTTASTEDDLSGITICTDLLPLLGAYFKSELLYKFLDEVEILGVEFGFELPLQGDLILPGRVDLLVYFKKGQYKGETAPVDNKFVYNFWSDDDFRMNSQIPSYMAGLRHTFPDRVIRRGIINQIRWRKNATEQFSMLPIKPEKGEIQAVIRNHILLAQKVEQLKELDLAEISLTATKTLSKYSCHNCGFKTLCKAQLTGGSTEKLIAMDYQRNSYGYGGDEE